MSPPQFLASGPSQAIRRELDELYRMCADQAARMAALEGEVFLLKRQMREQSEEPELTSRRSFRE